MTILQQRGIVVQLVEFEIFHRGCVSAFAALLMHPAYHNGRQGIRPATLFCWIAPGAVLLSCNLVNFDPCFITVVVRAVMHTKINGFIKGRAHTAAVPLQPA